MLGGLVPELLCAESQFQHAGTTDVDVQVDLTTAVVKFELLADLHDQPTEATIVFEECKNLGALNLRGTGFASRDLEVRRLRAQVGGDAFAAEVNVVGLAGFLLAKTAAAYSRRKPKDWYDIVFVLRHNDAGGPMAAANVVRDRFADDIQRLDTALNDLQANFADRNAQGTQAYLQQMMSDYPDLDGTTLATDAVLSVEEFLQGLDPVRHRRN